MRRRRIGLPRTSRRSSEADAVGLAALAYYLPPKTLSVDGLARAGKLESSKKTLRAFGFARVHVADRTSADNLAEKAVARLFRRSRIRPADIDVILYCSALSMGSSRKTGNPAALFQYPATLLQYRFGMSRANVIGICQAGCVSFLSATRLAADMIRAESQVHRVLCVSSDVLPPAAKREVLYNLISDGACAAVVERHCERNRLVSWSQATKGFYWDSANKENEIIASYFPTARFVIHAALEKARLRLSDIRLIIPHNVNRKSWEILLQLLGARKTQFFGRNIKTKGHTIAADNIINLQDAIRAGRVRRGDYLLLFTFGFGAHWACTILQH